MCNKDDLVSYLYDDLDQASRAALERHLRACDACRDELAGMRAVRADLLAWTPPEPEFAFRLVAEPRGKVLTPAVPSWRSWLKPAAGLAAAAVLVLAAAAGMARIEVRKDADGWTLRTGSSADAAADASRTAAFAPRAAIPPDTILSTNDGGAFAALERRIVALEASSRDSSNVRNASLFGARASNEEILKVVRDLLAQSETRQKGELALRIAQVMRDVNAQRVADLTRVQQGIGRIDATVADEAAAHRELMNYILTSNSKTK